jgi:hypothetical protein
MAYYRDKTGKFRQLSDNPNKYIDVFGEFDFICDDDECNFFCPDCRNMMKCEAYEEIKDEWESFYM